MFSTYLYIRVTEAIRIHRNKITRLKQLKYYITGQFHMNRC